MAQKLVGASGQGPCLLLGEMTANLYTSGKDPIKREKLMIQERKKLLEWVRR